MERRDSANCPNGIGPPSKEYLYNTFATKEDRVKRKGITAT